MSGDLILPAIVTVVLGAAAGLVGWPVRPMLAVRFLTAIALAVAVTAVTVLSVVVAGFAARWALVLSLIEWCPVVPLHHQVGILEGTLATGALVAVGVRTRLVLRRWRQAVAGTQGRRLAVVDSADPIAYAAPGDPGCVVVSRGLLDVLGPRERQVVLAHERAHLHLRHHRYLLAGEIAVAVVPLLRPLAGQIRLATECSADECAAEALGGDRRLVARTIARVAITRSVHGGLVGAFGGGSVPLRVRALVGPPRGAAVATGAFGIIAATAVMTIAAGSIQVHHFVELVEHVCRF